MNPAAEFFQNLTSIISQNRQAKARLFLVVYIIIQYLSKVKVNGTNYRLIEIINVTPILYSIVICKTGEFFEGPGEAVVTGKNASPA